MSLAIGFHCEDGIVLAADTLYSGRTARFGTKIWQRRRKHNGFAIAGAGSGPAIWAVADMCLSAPWKGTTRRAIASTVESQLIEFYKRHKSTLRDEPLEFLVVARGSDGAGLYLSENSPVLGLVDSFAAIGSNGSILASWLARKAFARKSRVSNASALASYIVRETMSFDSDVGGDTNVMIIPHRSETHWNTVNGGATVMPGIFADVLDPAFRLAVWLLEPNISEGVIDNWLTKYARGVKAARTEFFDPRNET